MERPLKISVVLSEVFPRKEQFDAALSTAHIFCKMSGTNRHLIELVKVSFNGEASVDFVIVLNLGSLGIQDEKVEAQLTHFWSKGHVVYRAAGLPFVSGELTASRTYWDQNVARYLCEACASALNHAGTEANMSGHRLENASKDFKEMRQH